MTSNDGLGVFTIHLAFDVDATSAEDAAMLGKDCCELLNVMWEAHGYPACTVVDVQRLEDSYDHLLPSKDRAP